MGIIERDDDGSVTVAPDTAGSSGIGHDIGEAPDPDYTVTLEMADRTVLVDLEAGEPMALNTPGGQIFAQISVSDYNE